MNERVITLDLIRGSAIIMMMMFHLSFDLNYFQIIEIDIYRALFWKFARWIIVSMFLFAVGYSLVLAHRKKIRWHKLFKRSALLALYALFISIATYMIFPHSWIYFGVLHFILIGSFLGLLFVRLPWLALLGSLLIFAGSYSGWLGTHRLYTLMQPVLMLPRSTEDLVPLFPWFGVVLLGIFAAAKVKLPAVSPSKSINKITFLGRHSLTVYMIHQPIFFGVLYLMTKLFP